MLSGSSLQEPILGGAKINESFENDPQCEVSSTPVTDSPGMFADPSSLQDQYFSPVASPWSSCFKDNSVVSQCSKNSTGVFCRICHEGEGEGEGERLISPCLCSGSVGLLHRSCIEKWLSAVNKDTCELCGQKYQVSRHSRPFSSWLLTPAVGDDQRNLVGDTICFMLLTPLTTISAYLCASGASYYFHQIKKSEAVGLLTLASLLILIYLIWLLLTIRYHFQVWFKWRNTNQEIRLLDVSSNLPVTSRKSPRSLVHKIHSRIFSQPADLESPDLTAEASQIQPSESASSLLEMAVALEETGEENRLPLTPSFIAQEPQKETLTRTS